MQIKPRQTTPEIKSRSYFTNISTQISHSGQDETNSEFNTQSCNVSQDKKKKEQSSYIKEKVLNKLKNYIQNREQESDRTFKFDLQLDKISKLSSQELANIYLQHHTIKSIIPHDRNKTAPKQIFKSVTQVQSGYQQLYHKRQGNVQISNNTNSKFFNSPQMKKIVDAQKDIYSEYQSHISTENIQLLSIITKDKDLQQLQIELDRRQQDLNELDLQILGAKMNIRQINNQTLQANFEHQDHIRKLEDELSVHNTHHEQQQEIYTNLVPQLNAYRQEDNEYQRLFHDIMEEINSLKKIKKIYDPTQEDKDSSKNQLQKIIEENIQLKAALVLNLDKIQRQAKQTIPEINHLKQNNKLKIQQLDDSSKQLKQNQINLKQVINAFKEKKTITLPKQHNYEVNQIDTQIQSGEAEKHLKQQELCILQTSSDAKSKLQEKKIDEQQKYINSMDQKLQVLQKESGLQDKSCLTQIKVQENNLIIIKVEIKTLQDSIQNQDSVLEKDKQNSKQIIRQNREQLQSFQKQVTTKNQKNQTIKEQIMIVKEKVSLKGDNKDIIVQIEKMDKQSVTLSQHINKRQEFSASCKEEIIKLNISLNVKNNQDHILLIDQINVLKLKNDKDLQGFLKLKDQKNQLQQENDEKEAMIIKQGRESGKLMEKIDDYSQNEIDLMKQIKKLESQLSEK